MMYTALSAAAAWTSVSELLTWRARHISIFIMPIWATQ